MIELITEGKVKTDNGELTVSNYPPNAIDRNASHVWDELRKVKEGLGYNGENVHAFLLITSTGQILYGITTHKNAEIVNVAKGMTKGIENIKSDFDDRPVFDLGNSGIKKGAMSALFTHIPFTRTKNKEVIFKILDADGKEIKAETPTW